MVLKLKLKSCLLALLGSAILAFGIYNVHSVSDISEGGILGLTLLIEYWTGLSPAISGLVFNVACYFLGWRTFGSSFIGYSIFACGGFSLFYAVFEKFPPVYPAISDYPLPAAIVGAIFVGLGCGISILAGGAPTGDDALGMSFSKRLSVNIRWIYLVTDATVLLLSLTYIPHTKILYSFITVFLSGQIIGIMQKHFERKEPPTHENVAPVRDVLVGTLRNTAQLEVCIRNKFYHIPAIRLYSGSFPINYIAIYQSLHKFGNDAGVYYYGEVENTFLVSRREIREIPRDSDEEYYRFDIKEWKKLEKPVLPSEGDFINLATTLFLLKNAKDTSELSLSGESELILYREFEKLIKKEVNKVTLPDGKTKALISGYNLVVLRNGSKLFSCDISTFDRSRLAGFRKIISYNKNEAD